MTTLKSEMFKRKRSVKYRCFSMYATEKTDRRTVVVVQKLQISVAYIVVKGGED